jgi:alpha-galactosidase
MAEAYTSNFQIEARFAGLDFIPDGNLKKSVWENASLACFDHDMSGRVAYPEIATLVASVWTEGCVYFAFKCRYLTLNLYEGEDVSKERWELWNRDVVEVFINPQPERVHHYYELEVAPNNQWIDLEIDREKTPFNDPNWNSGFQHATHVDPAEHLWTCEMRIPVASMGVERLTAGTVWRVNFFRADGPMHTTVEAGLGPVPTEARRLLAWSTIPNGNSFHVPTRFGILRFVR